MYVEEKSELLQQLGIELHEISVPFRLNRVNCFLAQGKDGWMLMDVGVNNPETVAYWQQQLQHKPLSNIILSHYHPDHIGCAGQLQKITNAQMSISAIDSEFIYKVWSKEGYEELFQGYLKAGIDYVEAAEMLESYKQPYAVVAPLPTFDHYLQDGDRVTFGHYEYEIIATPGHSPGLFVLYNQERKVLLSTDHVLEKIKPNVSYWFREETNPLEDYLQSLNKIKRLDIEYAIPSHGVVFQNVKERIQQLMQHHNLRLEEILTYVKGHHTVWEIAQLIYADKNLTKQKIRPVVGEIFSHLEYLRLKGYCQRVWKNDRWLYFR